MKKLSKRNVFLVAEKSIEFVYSTIFMTMIVAVQIIEEAYEEME